METGRLMIRPLLLILGLAAAALPALGQEEPKLIRAEFTVFPVLNIEQTGIFYKPAPDAAMTELRFRPGARSLKTYDYLGPSELSFYREAGLNEEGEMQYRRAGFLEVSASKMLIFFANNPAALDQNEVRPEFSLLAVDDSAGAMPADHIAFLNFTSIPFACRFMDRNFIVYPGENAPISVRDRLEEDVFIGLAITNKETHRVVLQSRWQFHPGNRHHVLLLPPQRENSFRIRAYRMSEFVGENPAFTSSATPQN
jgi:hypothetical protein